VLFTLETLIITVSAGAVAALVLGFVSGNTKKQRSGSVTYWYGSLSLANGSGSGSFRQ
jgi:hypothetical protein